MPFKFIMVQQHNVVIVQRILTHYRKPFYDLLKERLVQSNIELIFIYGAPVGGEAKKSDTTSYLGGGFLSLIKSYFNKYSRRYLKSEIIFYLRHGIPLLLPIFLASSLL